MQFWRNKKIMAVIMAAIAAASIILLMLSNVFQPLQTQLSDRLYRERTPSKNIVMVYLDEKTLSSTYGLGPYLNWNRGYYAKVLGNLNKYHPRVVGLDFFFNAEKDQETDQALADVLARTEAPIIVGPMSPDEQNAQGIFVQKPGRGFNDPMPLYTKLKNVLVAAANIIPDSDSVVRRIMPAIINEENGTVRENFPFAIVRKYYGLGALNNQPEIKDGKYIMRTTPVTMQVPLEDGQMLINYSNDPQKSDYPNISFIDVYNEKYENLKDQNGNQISPKEFFKDKIVLIGAQAFALNDLSITAINKSNLMPRITIIANAIQTMLEGRFLINTPQNAQIIFVILLCFISTLIFMYSGKIRWSILFMLGAGIIYTVSAPYFFDHGIILDLVHPFIALLGSFMAVYLYRYLTEFREKNQLKSAFSKYVNKNLVEQIIAKPEELKLGGQKREVTVIFTDIAHFTSISENLQPESLVALLNEYFDAMSQVILEAGGTLDKFEGDGIMAFFGAPLSQPDHAIRACNVAMRMRAKLGELLVKWKSDPPLPGGEPKPMLDFRCGISTGEAIIGNIGASDRFDYTAMGDIVNLGSRLEGANKKYDTHILMSEATYQQIKNHFEVRQIDNIKVVGKNKPIRIYEILNVKDGLVLAAQNLLALYNEGLELYLNRKFDQALEKFTNILKVYPTDGPAKTYQQRCAILKDFPPPSDWDGVFQMGSK